MIIKQMAGILPLENARAVHTTQTTLLTTTAGVRYVVHGIQVSGGTGGSIAVAAGASTIFNLDIPADTPVIIPVTLKGGMGEALTITPTGLTSPMINFQYSIETY